MKAPFVLSLSTLVVLVSNVVRSSAVKTSLRQLPTQAAPTSNVAPSALADSTPQTVVLANDKVDQAATAPAPAPGPAGPTLPAVEVSFELDNYNYFDMDRAVDFPDEVVNVTGFLNYTIPPMPDIDYKIPGVAGVPELTYTIPENASAEEISALVREPPGGWKAPKSLVNTRNHVVSARVGVKASDDEIMSVDGSLSLKANKNIVQSRAKAFMELAAKKKTTVKHILKDAIEEALTKVLKAGLAKGPGPAPAAALIARGIVAATASAPAPGAAAEVSSGRMFVKITPGRPGILQSFIQMKSVEEPNEAEQIVETAEDDTEDVVETAEKDTEKVAEDVEEDVDKDLGIAQATTVAPEMQQPGKSTNVDVLIMNDPAAGKDMLGDYLAVLTTSLNSGELQMAISSALCDATGIAPVISGLKAEMTAVENWDVAQCEAHMQTLVSRFSMAYTRRMVPTAIFNECTNFIPKLSFSHDDMVNKADIYRCRVATAKFSKGWQFGQGVQVPSGPAPAAAAPSPAAAAAPGPGSAPKYVQLKYKELCFNFCEIKFGKLAPQCHVTSGDKLMAGGPSAATATAPA